MAHSSKFLIVVLLALSFHTLRAADPNSPETRLRETLRNTVLQLRSVTSERDDLQAQVADLQNQAQQLKTRVATLTKQGVADRDTAAKTIAVLQSRLSTQEETIAEFQKSQAASEASQKQTAVVLNTLQARQAALTADNATLQRALDGATTRNVAMLKLASEILGRYEKQGLGEVILAKEPFVGIARTKLQNLAQDYQLKLLAQRVKP
jgi:peptidoglycan hydrolase CwlO-like protein